MKTSELKLNEEIMASELYIALSSENIKTKEIENDISDIVNGLKEFEKKYSRFLPNNELSRLNTNSNVNVSQELFEMLKISKDYFLNTKGIFNPAIKSALIKEGYNLSKKVNYHKDELIVVNESSSTDLNLLDLDKKTLNVKKPKDMQIDLGGIGKGYIIEKICKTLSEKYTHFCLSIGGDMYLSGVDQKNKYPYWAIEILNPFESLTLETPTLLVKDMAIATSGTYKRKWQMQGVEKNHLIDTNTLASTDSDLVSVTVINKSPIYSDIMAKVLLLNGCDEAIDLCKDEEIAAVLISKNKEVYASKEANKYVWKNKILLSILIMLLLGSSVVYGQENVKDTDLDGLSDTFEVEKYKTDPNSPDTDKDGVIDYQEILDKTNPLVASSNKLNFLKTQDTPTMWYVGRISGITAFILFTLVICMGLAMTSKVLLKIPFIKAPEVLESHQFTATFLAFGFMLLHMISFMYDDVIALSLKEILIPFSAKRDITSVMGANLGLAIALGVIAFYLSVILVLTSRLRRKLVPIKIWRTVHYSSFLFYIMFITHGFFAGSDSKEGWMRLIYVVSLTLVVSLILLRIFGKKYFLPKMPATKNVSPINQIPLPKKCEGRIRSTRYLNNRDLEIVVSTDNSFTFSPGQFVSLNVGNGLFRSYSIASGIKDLPNLTLIASVSHDGAGSNYLKQLKVGDKIDFIGPSGRFFLPENLANKLVFIATGTGIAPLLSMVYKLIDIQFKKEIVFLFGVRDDKEIFYQDKLEEISKNLNNFNYKICYSQEIPTDNDVKMLLGRVTDVKEVFESPDKDANYFICGNPYMVGDVMKLLLDKGVDSNKIFHEKFTVSKPLTPELSSK